MHGVLAREAFAVDGQRFCWRDVVAAGRAWGDWLRLEDEVRRALAGARRAESRGDAPAAAAVQAAANEFRYDRRLLSADEMEAWLARWGLETEGWLAYVQRSLLEERALDGSFEGSVEPDPLTVWTHAVCSGELERLAHRLAERTAVYASVADEPHRVERLAQMDESFERFLERAVTAEAVDAAIEAHIVEWTRLDCLWLETPSDEVAREVALCVREDGRELEDVARDADLSVERRRIYVDDADPEVAPHLLGARAGDLIGPVPHAGGFALVLVQDRVAPVPEAADLRARAKRHLTKQAVEREVLRHVRWHVP